MLLGLSVSTGTLAQSRSADEEAVRLLDDEMRAAVLKQDQPALERLLSDQFTVNAPSHQVVIGRRAVLALIQRSPRESFERKIEYIRVVEDFGIIMGAETLNAVGDAPAGQTVQRRFTNIWKKEAGTWRMIARHANVITTR